MPKTKAGGRQGSPIPVKPVVTSKTAGSGSATPLLSSVTYAVTLLAYFWYTLTRGNLVSDPVRTLTENIVALVLIQIVYCISGGLDGQNVLQQGSKLKQQKSEIGLSTKISVSLWQGRRTSEASNGSGRSPAAGGRDVVS